MDDKEQLSVVINRHVRVMSSPQKSRVLASVTTVSVSAEQTIQNLKQQNSMFEPLYKLKSRRVLIEWARKIFQEIVGHYYSRTENLSWSQFFHKHLKDFQDKSPFQLTDAEICILCGPEYGIISKPFHDMPPLETVRRLALLYPYIMSNQRDGLLELEEQYRRNMVTKSDEPEDNIWKDRVMTILQENVKSELNNTERLYRSLNQFASKVGGSTTDSNDPVHFAQLLGDIAREERLQAFLTKFEAELNVQAYKSMSTGSISDKLKEELSIFGPNSAYFSDTEDEFVYCLNTKLNQPKLDAFQDNCEADENNPFKESTSSEEEEINLELTSRIMGLFNLTADIVKLEKKTTSLRNTAAEIYFRCMLDKKNLRIIKNSQALLSIKMLFDFEELRHFFCERVHDLGDYRGQQEQQVTPVI